MFNFKNLFNIKDSEKERRKIFIADIINASSPDFNFYMMVSSSAIITSLGLITNNIALVIDGMIVAPLLSPILAISLGFITISPKMIYRSIKILFFSAVLSIFFSMIVGLIFDINIHTISFIDKMNISWINFTIAVVAGITASYSWTKKEGKDYLPGIAIAVTIIPPLATIGLLIPSADFLLLKNISLFFLMNIFGIFLSGLIVFFLMNFRKSKNIINSEIKKEEKIINANNS